MQIRILSAILILMASSAAVGQVRGGCDTKVADRTGVWGCYLVASEQLGVLPAEPLFWHLYTYPKLADAQAHRGPRSTVVESLGQVRLYAIAGRDWRPAGGKRMAVVGPLPHDAGHGYTARYMEAVFETGKRTAVHTHSGPEAWYVLAGIQCLETPDGITVVRAGEGSLVPEGPPMMLSSVGTAPRRATRPSRLIEAMDHAGDAVEAERLVSEVRRRR
jgi:mannose-6-phosphate isomerase-like protein (cupin superfamily)